MRVMEAVADIDVKRAVQAAKDFAVALFEPEQLSGLGLEAIERTEDGKHWLVTLGFQRAASRARRRARISPLERVLPSPEPDREYKVFKVDAGSGEVLGMQMFRD